MGSVTNEVLAQPEMSYNHILPTLFTYFDKAQKATRHRCQHLDRRNIVIIIGYQYNIIRM